MYSIMSLKNHPQEPFKSVLKPNGKAETLALVVGALAGTIVFGVGLYVFLHHGLDIPQIGTLGTKAGYLCLIVPSTAILSDYLIGSVIKAVKNHQVSKQTKQAENEGANSNPPASPFDKNETTETAVQKEVEEKQLVKSEDNFFVLNQEENEIDKIEKEITRTQSKKNQLENSKNQLTEERKDVERQMQLISSSRQAIQELIGFYALESKKANNEFTGLINNSDEREKFFERNKVVYNNGTDPKKVENQRSEFLQKWIQEKEKKIKKLDEEIESKNKEIEILEKEFNLHEDKALKISDQIRGIEAEIDILSKNLKDLIAKFEDLEKPEAEKI